MAKFNVVQKKRRAQIADRKRAIHGDPVTGKLKTRPQSLSVSGKRKRKLLKKWRRDQKEAVEKGLLNMEDVEMASAEEAGTSQDTNRTPTAFHMKKSLKLKKLKRRGKGKGKSSTLAAAAETSRDAMTE